MPPQAEWSAIRITDISIVRLSPKGRRFPRRKWCPSGVSNYSGRWGYGISNYFLPSAFASGLFIDTWKRVKTEFVEEPVWRFKDQKELAGKNWTET
jgi:hypothetical protein